MVEQKYDLEIIKPYQVMVLNCSKDHVDSIPAPTVLGVRARGNNTQPHRKVLALDGFCGKRYNAESDGARKSTVPIILTVGKMAAAFPAGSVKGWQTQPITYDYREIGCRVGHNQFLTHIQRKNILQR